MQTTKVELVTPEFARQLLEKSRVNRKIQKTAVIEYCQMMQRGEWQSNAGEPIQVLEDGSTGNGHHRAYAVLMLGEPVKMLVSRNVPPDARLNVDRGLRRTLKDDFAMFRRNVKNPLYRAAYMRLCARLMSNNVRIRSLSDYDAWHKIFGKGVDWAAEVFANNAKVIRSQGVAGGLAFAYKMEPKAVEEFGWQVASGEGLRTGDPAYALRNYLSLIARGVTGDARTREIVARKTICMLDAFRHRERISRVEESAAVFREYVALYEKQTAPLIAPWLQALPDPVREKKNGKQLALPMNGVKR